MRRVEIHSDRCTCDDCAPGTAAGIAIAAGLGCGLALVGIAEAFRMVAPFLLELIR